MAVMGNDGGEEVEVVLVVAWRSISARLPLMVRSVEKDDASPKEAWTTF